MKVLHITNELTKKILYSIINFFISKHFYKSYKFILDPHLQSWENLFDDKNINKIDLTNWISIFKIRNLSKNVFNHDVIHIHIIL